MPNSAVLANTGGMPVIGGASLVNALELLKLGRVEVSRRKPRSKFIRQNRKEAPMQQNSHSTTPNHAAIEAEMEALFGVLSVVEDKLNNPRFASAASSLSKLSVDILSRIDGLFDLVISTPPADHESRSAHARAMARYLVTLQLEDMGEHLTFAAGVLAGDMNASSAGEAA